MSGGLAYPGSVAHRDTLWPPTVGRGGGPDRSPQAPEPAGRMRAPWSASSMAAGARARKGAIRPRGTGPGLRWRPGRGLMSVTRVNLRTVIRLVEGVWV
jgi:hypothetical protein